VDDILTIDVCDDVSGNTSSGVREVNERCCDEVADKRSLLIVCNDELVTSFTRDWPDQQQLIDVTLSVVML